jgi:hypothetical protein
MSWVVDIMKDETTNLYLKTMIGSVYKILPMYDCNDITLKDHLNSLYVQLVGGSEYYEELKYNQRYHSIINIVQFFRTQEFDKKICKREVLKATNILDKLSKM